MQVFEKELDVDRIVVQQGKAGHECVPNKDANELYTKGMF